MTSAFGPPPRPSWREERPAAWLFRALGPRLPRAVSSPPPAVLEPFEPLTIARAPASGRIAATFFPAPQPARGAVLFLHPWFEWGQAYFFRRGRIQAVRQAGYHALTLDLPGFGGSSAAAGFPDRDVEAGLDALGQRAAGLPQLVWGVSAGGYWAHPVLARRAGVAAAFFEDVSPHLLEWSSRVSPMGRPAFGFFRMAFPRAYAFLDMRRHAPELRLEAVAYVSGALDRGVRPEDTQELAQLARGEACIVAEAGHLAAIKREPAQVISLALNTFARAAG